VFRIQSREAKPQARDRSRRVAAIHELTLAARIPWPAVPARDAR
jgi:hypothetical protein